MVGARTPRGAWIDAALHALAAGGPDAVRVEALAAGLGVSKGGFYWHFRDRRTLLAEMLDAWQQAVVEDVISLVDSQPADPRVRLRHLFELASSREGLAVELAMRDWSRRDPDVAERMRRVDDQRMGYLRSLFGQICTDERDVEARSLLVMTLFVGSNLVSLGDGARSRHEVLARAYDLLLAEPGG